MFDIQNLQEEECSKNFDHIVESTTTQEIGEWQRWYIALNGYIAFESNRHSQYLVKKKRTRRLEKKKSLQIEKDFSLKSTFYDPSNKKQQMSSRVSSTMSKRSYRRSKDLSKKDFKKIEKMFGKCKYTADEISQYFGITIKKVYQYLKEFERSKSLSKYYPFDKQKNGSRYNDRQSSKNSFFKKEKLRKICEAIDEIITKSPKSYQFQIKAKLKRDYGIIISQATISRCMSKIKLVKKKPAKIFIESNTQANIDRRYEYCKLFQQIDPMKCLFLDQSGINNRIRREKGWVKKGVPLHCEQPADGANKYSLLAMISFEKMHEHILKFGACNSKDMVSFINTRIADKYKDYILILDNAKIHKTPEVKQALARHNMRFHFLPPYSPYLNPIQNVFHEFKNLIRDHRAEQPEQQLKTAINYALQKIQKRNFYNYQGYIQRWVEKGLRKQRFETNDRLG